MVTINQLTQTDDLSAGDLFPLYSGGNGDARSLAASALQSYMQDNLDFSDGNNYVSQYATPSATGFSVTITDGELDDSNVHLILTPLAGYAAGTIVLPPRASIVDKQELLLNTTQSVTTLTVSANGASGVIGAPTTLAANAFFRLKFDAVSANWYRVG